MLILKIKKVFLPSAISEKGILYDYMELPYIGFCAEVIQELDGNEPIENSQFLDVEFTIIERDTMESAEIHKGDTVSVSKQYLSQGLLGLSCDEWISMPRLLINNNKVPIIHRTGYCQS